MPELGAGHFCIFLIILSSHEGCLPRGRGSEAQKVQQGQWLEGRESGEVHISGRQLTTLLTTNTTGSQYCSLTSLTSLLSLACLLGLSSAIRVDDSAAKKKNVRCKSSRLARSWGALLRDSLFCSKRSLLSAVTERLYERLAWVPTDLSVNVLVDVRFCCLWMFEHVFVFKC